MRQKPVDLDTLDRAIINRLQDGLPLVSEPFAGIAAELGLEVDDLLARVARLREMDADQDGMMHTLPTSYARASLHPSSSCSQVNVGLSNE